MTSIDFALSTGYACSSYTAVWPNGLALLRWCLASWLATVNELSHFSFQPNVTPHATRAPLPSTGHTIVPTCRTMPNLCRAGHAPPFLNLEWLPAVAANVGSFQRLGAHKTRWIRWICVWNLRRPYISHDDAERMPTCATSLFNRPTRPAFLVIVPPSSPYTTTDQGLARWLASRRHMAA